MPINVSTKKKFLSTVKKDFQKEKEENKRLESSTFLLSETIFKDKK